MQKSLLRISSILFSTMMLLLMPGLTTNASALEAITSARPVNLVQYYDDIILLYAVPIDVNYIAVYSSTKLSLDSYRYTISSQKISGLIEDAYGGLPFDSYITSAYSKLYKNSTYSKTFTFSITDPGDVFKVHSEDDPYAYIYNPDIVVDRTGTTTNYFYPNAKWYTPNWECIPTSYTAKGTKITF